jgi:hypothetical protein
MKEWLESKVHFTIIQSEMGRAKRDQSRQTDDLKIL